ncbi:synaptotagmin 14 [Rhodnius prolixus]|uniref:synaptotagmin 14 n=1 Tax=Rhodnius prolixus TaxID=13249 RepID=UPI003D188BCA
MMALLFNGDESRELVVGLASVCLVVLVVLGMYLRRKLVTQYGIDLNLSCCDKGTVKSSNESSTLGEAFSVSEMESSSDSDEEVLNKFKNSMNFRQNSSNNNNNNNNDHHHFNIESRTAREVEDEEASSASSCCSTTTEDGIRNRERRFKHPVDSFPEHECVVVMGEEPVFDMSDKRTGEHGAGALQVSLAYDQPTRNLTLHVLQATDMPPPPAHIQVRAVLLSHKKQRYKSKSRQGENPQFMESFLFHKISFEELDKLGIRLRVYYWGRLRRPRLIGETCIFFAHVNLNLESNMWLMLEPPSRHSGGSTACAQVSKWSPGPDVLSVARSESTSSSVSLRHGLAELMLGLAYSGTTGRLTVEVIKGSHFRDWAVSRAPDTYVKLSLVSSSGHELIHSKTSVRRAQPHPLFKEKFIYQVALFQLADVTLMVSVYCRRPIKRKEMLGWICLGHSSSGEEELSHWQDMCQVRGEQVSRWHVLIEA